MAGLVDCNWDDWCRDGDLVANRSAGTGDLAMRFFWWIADPRVLIRAIALCVAWYSADALGWQSATSAKQRVDPRLAAEQSRVSDRIAAALVKYNESRVELNGKETGR